MNQITFNGSVETALVRALLAVAEYYETLKRKIV